MNTINLVSQPLDYEYFYENNLPPRMTLTVTVSDGGTPNQQHVDTATVVITGTSV